MDRRLLLTLPSPSLYTTGSRSFLCESSFPPHLTSLCLEPQRSLSLTWPVPLSTSCQSVSHPHYTHRSGYANAGLSVLDRVEGGAPWGAATIAGGDGSRQPSETELSICTYQVSLDDTSTRVVPRSGGKGEWRLIPDVVFHNRPC